MRVARLTLSRAQILGFRLQVGGLNQRAPLSANALRKAAECGLQDSVPRAALHSIHARVQGTRADTWTDPGLIQIWGPRYCVYLVAEEDLALFTLGRLPDTPRGRTRAMTTAERLHTLLAGQRQTYSSAGRALRVPPNSLRYAVTTGRVILRWEGAGQPLVWTRSAPTMEPFRARCKLARRFIHTFVPTTEDAFARWAGLSASEARNAFAALRDELIPVSSPIGDSWILGEDETAIRTRENASASTRLLPSGDSYLLHWGADRQLLLPNSAHRLALWTTRVWPGGILVDGEIVGTWRRSGDLLSLTAWRRLSSAERASIEAEVASLPLPGLSVDPQPRWV